MWCQACFPPLCLVETRTSTDLPIEFQMITLCSQWAGASRVAWAAGFERRFVAADSKTGCCLILPCPYYTMMYFRMINIFWIAQRRVSNDAWNCLDTFQRVVGWLAFMYLGSSGWKWWQRYAPQCYLFSLMERFWHVLAVWPTME